MTAHAAAVYDLLRALVAAKREAEARGLICESLLRAAISDRVALREAEARIAALKARCDEQQALISLALGLDGIADVD